MTEYQQFRYINRLDDFQGKEGIVLPPAAWCVLYALDHGILPRAGDHTYVHVRFNMPPVSGGNQRLYKTQAHEVQLLDATQPFNIHAYIEKWLNQEDK